ncbi:MAG TPA: hypothetical protein VEX15_08745 [Nocardioidaceae bacterium]|nr:hypothetical protein [Nocardioidaceae bacterium]
MRRKTFDALLAAGGLVVAAILLVAGGLLVWAHAFINDQVESQLSAQQIYFPEQGSESLNDPAVKPYIEQYAGEQVTSGEQAKTYADHYIKVHLSEMTGGQTYSQLSAQSLEQPNNEELAGQVQTVFRGETLRGLLLDAYAFWKIGQIALYASIAAFIGAGIMILLSGLGFWHLRRAPADQEVLPSIAKSDVATDA